MDNQSIPPDNLVFIAQTQAEVDHIIKEGLTAELNPMLRGEKPSDYVSNFKGRKVIVLSDFSYDGQFYASSFKLSLDRFIPISMVTLQKDLFQYGEDDFSRIAKEDGRSSYQRTRQTRRPGIDLEVTTLRDVKQCKPHEFLIDRFLVWGWLHLLTGAQESFKSYATLFMSLSVLTGTPLFGKFPVHATGAVLIVNEENPQSLLRDRAEKMKIDEKLPLYFLNFQSVQIDDDACFDALMAKIEQIRPVFLVFDSLIRIHNQLENEAKAMSTVMAKLRRISNTGVTTLIIHHQRKATGGTNKSMARGSTDIPVAVDIEYGLNKIGNVLTFETMKTRIENFGSFKVRIASEGDSLGLVYEGFSTGAFEDKVTSEIISIVNLQTGEGIVTEEIRDELNIRKIRVGINKIRHILNGLIKEGKICREERKSGRTTRFVYKVCL